VDLLTYIHDPELHYSFIAKLHTLQITTLLSFYQPAVSPTAISSQRLLTVEILQLPALISLLSGEYPATKLNQPTWASRYVASAGNPTENTCSNSFFYFVMGGCLAMTRISFTCSLAVTKQRMFLLAIVGKQ
jgi:hypothetical protein